MDENIENREFEEPLSLEETVAIDVDGFSIGKIENEICSLMKVGTTKWVELYRMIAKVEAEELYRPEFSTLSAWATNLAKRGGFILRELWRYKKSGEFYEGFVKRQVAAGRKVKTLETVVDEKKVFASPRAFETIRKIAGGDHEKEDHLISKLVKGEINGSQLQQMWKTEKENGAKVLKSRHDSYTDKAEISSEDGDLDAVDGNLEDDSDVASRHMTASDIVQALMEHHDWLPEPEIHLPYISDKYRVFSEFPVYAAGTSSSARMDALVVETIGSGKIDRVFLHGIEIKIDIHDLENDVKMYQYMDFCDSFWIAVPEHLRDAALLYARERLAGAGVLIVSEAGIEVATEAKIQPGIMRDKALEHLVYKLF